MGVCMKEKGRAGIYTIAGIYLLITDYSLWSRLFGTIGLEYLLMMVFAIIFAVAGAGLIGFGVYIMHSISKLHER